jgi:hypothetical protein
MTSLMGFLFVPYVALFPVYRMAEYFRLIQSDRGLGEALLYLYYPLLWLDLNWPPFHRFLEWLMDLYLSPFGL